MVAFVVAVAAPLACVPEGHVLEGRACNAVHPCPSPLFCVNETCSVDPLPTANPDGGQWVATITGLNLVSANTGQDIFPHAPMQDGASFSRALTSGRGISIRAFTSPEVVTLVDFTMFGPLRLQRTELNEPYYLNGDNAQDGGITGIRPDAGFYRLTVTPFVGSEAGESKVITFTITQ